MRLAIVAHALVVAVVAHLCLVSPTVAGEPTDQIRAYVEGVYQVVGTSAFQGMRPGDRRDALRKVVDDMFDWPAMAQQALGRHWSARTSAEQADFVRLFADVFERAYLSSSQLGDADRFDYVSDTIEGDQAVVRTTVMTKRGSRIPVDYRARLENGTRWKVYDLDFEGMSLVRNYRAQFNAIITRSSYQDLVKSLRGSAKE